MNRYYDEAGITIYHGDCRDIVTLGLSRDLNADGPAVMLTDPPFGIGYETHAPRLEGNARSICGDESVALRDYMVEWFDGEALVFGSPRAPEPPFLNARLIWDQDGALGMGDLMIPWKPSWQFIFVIGRYWAGRRDCGSVLRYPPVQSMGRAHPHEKPVGLLQMLLGKCRPGVVFDPFMGSGSTLVAAKSMNRRAVGIEIEEKYCEVAAKRLAQEVLDFTASPFSEEAGEQ